jgi:CHAT domain-containing protein
VLLLSCALARPASAGCIESQDSNTRLLDRKLTLKGDAESRVELPVSRGQDAIVYAIESGVDVELEIRDGAGAKLGRAESPLARNGRQRVILPAATRTPVIAVVHGLEHPGVSGTVRLVMDPLPAGREAGDCPTVERALAAADKAYAQSRGASSSVLGAVAAQYEKVLASLDEKTSGDDLGELQLTLAAFDYYDLQDWTHSALWADKAAVTLRKANRPYLRARAQAILAAASLELATKSSASGQSSSTPATSRAMLDKARELLAQVAEFHAQRNESYDRALQLNNIGLAYYYESRYEPAIKYYRQALPVFERLGEMQRVASVVENIGLCEWGLGRLSAAIPMFDRALALIPPELYPDIYVATLYNSSTAHLAAGRFDESLRLSGQALDFATRLKMDRARGRAYYSMGVTYYAIGDHDLAARFLRSAAEILTPDVDARIRVATLRALATIESETGNFSQASAYDAEALRLATAPSARSRILLRLASDYGSQGDAAAALKLLDPLAIQPPNGDMLVQALAQSQRARLNRAAGSLELARRDVQQSLATLKNFDAVTDEFDARVELARIERAAGNDAAALAALDEALRHTDEITSQTANPEFRASIAQSVRPALELKIDLLWRQYQRAASPREQSARDALIEALRTADNSRALAFEQLRSQRLNNSADPRIAELQRTTATLYRDLAERRFQLASRENNYGGDDPAAQSLREDISRLRARLGVANTELASRAAPTSTRANVSDADWIARALAAPANKGYVEYWIGADSEYAWTISGGRSSWVRLDSSAQIDKVARNLHEAMRSYTSTPVRARLESGAELYKLVFAPIKAQLSGARDLTIVPDGALHYVPFGTMRDPTAEKPFLAQLYAIELSPALRLASAPRAAKPSAWANSRMLLVADPVYSQDDPRLTHSAQRGGVQRLTDILRMRGGVDPATLERLVSSALESERIRALPGLRRVDLLEGFDATRARVLSQDLTQYRFIHIASHGFIDSEIPQLSALILGAWDRNGRVADQYVRAGDLLSRTFDAEMVVLSACDTALGRQIAGEGLVGLRYAALARGARSVVASLWPVSDAIAADLMTSMYRYITIDGNAVAAALSAAIRAELTRTPSLDPALWGPFAVYVAGD